MNHLFRIATRTLSWGLAATLTLVLVVIAKGVHPEVLVAFKPLSPAAASDFERQPQPPELFAQVEPHTRLDSPAGIRTAMGKRPNPVTARRAPAGNLSDPTEQANRLPQLPPLPVNGDGDTDPADTRPEAEILNAPPEPDSAEPTRVARNETSSSRAFNPRLDARSTAVVPSAPVLGHTKESEYLDRLATLQQQLNQLARAQEQSRIVHQSWLESHQILQQSKLQTQLNGIEASLQALSEKPSRPGSESSKPASQATNPDQPQGEQPASETAPGKTKSTGPGTGSITRDGPHGPKRTLNNSQTEGVREVLDALDKKANLNLMFEINVDGNVEMNLKEATAEEALEVMRKSAGQVGEKSTRKTQPRPATPMSHQREVFLPPIVKNPSPLARIRE